ncbi:MAG: prolipoprotein diacylglyceryl transferase [Candidatus Nanoarchaeia archaeon]
MFYHNINPVLANLGPFQIRFYGLVYFIGFLFLYFYFRFLIRRNKIKSLNEEKLDLFLIYFMLGSIIGARVLDFVFFNFNTLLQDPLEVFKVWHGGMSIHGGLIGGFLGSYIFARRHKIKFYELADNTIMPLMFFLGIGRLANFVNGELEGTRSAASFCIDYTKNQYLSYPPEGCRHPYVIYESLKNFAVAFILLGIKAKAKLKEGLLFWYGILLYNFLRFFVDFFRDAGEPRALGISMTQLLCLIFTIVSVVMIIIISRMRSKEETNNKKRRNKSG